MSGPEFSIEPGIGSNSNNQVSTFSQQGSVDWVALSRMQLSTSIAILGRLSGAGIEPLTVAVGRAICSYIPLGAHGERILDEAMNKLKAFSTIGDVVWFGVGVRHILRELVQTSQGASCVAFCAALTEGHSNATAALILYEMTKVLGSPQDLSPSFPQWKALVKVCSSVFASTSFGIRLQQYLKLSGFLSRRGNRPEGIPHPRDFVYAILAIGKVVNGAFQYIEITGGPVLCWLTAYTENILGLRVQLRNASNELLFMNHSVDTSSPSQVFFKFTNDNAQSSSLQCIRQSYQISNGETFVRRFFGDPFSQYRGSQNIGIADWTPLEGRVQWITLFQDTFGQDIYRLLNLSKPKSWLHPSAKCIEGVALDLLSCAASYVMTFPEGQIYSNNIGFIQAMIALLPELEEIREPLLQRGQQVLQDPEVDYQSSYQNLREAFHKLCNCSLPTYYFCPVLITELIVVITLMVGRLKLESPILPSRAGIKKLYRGLRRHKENISDQFIDEADDYADLDLILARYIILFSGKPIEPLSDKTIISEPDNRVCRSSMSDGKVYCYVSAMRGLSDRLEQASRIHVGAGGICANSHYYDCTYDKTELENLPRQWPQHTASKLLDITELFQDTTSPGLRSRAVVEEGARLIFWFEMEKDTNRIIVSPGDLILRLAEALMYKYPYPRKKIHVPVDFWMQYPSKTLVGEGPIDWDLVQGTELLIRPHQGNLLGRIVALYTSGFTWMYNAILIDNEDDLKQFAEYLLLGTGKRRYRQSDLNAGWTREWALIS